MVSVPARLPAAEEAQWIETMVARLLSKRGTAPAGDEALMRRAKELSKEYLEGRATPESVRWVSNQRRRWGSATAADRTIRLSDRIKGMPPWVIDAVLVHELAHLIADDGHGPRFRAWERRYPRQDEATAFLHGASWAMDQAERGDLGHQADGAEAGVDAPEW